MHDKITVRIPTEVAEAFEQFLEERPDCGDTRQDAMRYILRDWLIGQGYLALPPRQETSTGGR
ncbi:hypothetical protein [Pelagibacterium sp.]|uniref:hypothetical protein n=1 Tax=Pelagibacterium sp. TaxID=1967288 RepID=UPI003A8E13AE